ncbi:MAG: FAD-binding protein [Proteobacteria bacterium]|nr:FAD-binding protein [Pseudomonadota bacterium]
MKNGLARDLKKQIGKDNVKTDSEDLLAYCSDATHQSIKGKPDAIVLPLTPQDISKIVSYASKHQVPVVPRGAGSGLSGSSTPIKGGIVLDIKRMNRIIDINKGNLTAIAEAGVVLARFHKQVEKENLFYPPDPQSMSVCTLGGNVSTRAGGPRGVKYGTTGNYILGLEVVLPDGSIIHTGGSCVKQSVGYDITHLMTGAEGTLGVITKVTTRLLPLPAAKKTIIVKCRTTEQAAIAVSDIIAAGIIPSMLEFLSLGAIALMNTLISPPIVADGEAYLFIEIDGFPVQIEEDAKRIKYVCEDVDVMEIRVVEDKKEAASYWKARSSLYPLVLSFVKKVIVEDVTVPRNRIPEFVKSIEKISASTGIAIGVSGHAGDGNMHPSVLMGDVSEEMEKKAQDAIRQIVACGLELGGSISGEHGIGIHKAEFILQEMGARQIELFKSIKKAIDPEGIMNPGKIWIDGDSV